MDFYGTHTHTHTHNPTPLVTLFLTPFLRVRAGASCAALQAQASSLAFHTRSAVKTRERPHTPRPTAPSHLASSAGPIMNIPPAMKVILSDTQLSGHIVSAALFAAFEGRSSQRAHRPCPLLLDLVTKSGCKMT